MKKAFIYALAAAILLPVFSIATEKDMMPYVSDTECYTLEGENAVFCPEERGSLVRAVKPGSAVIFPIENAQRAEDLKGLKPFTVRWEIGEEFVQRPYIEYRKLYEEDGYTKKGYSYVVVLPVLSLAGEQKATVRGSLTLGQHSTGNFKRKFSFVIRDDGQSPYAECFECTGKSFPVDFGTYNQVELLFDDKAKFKVDAKSQGPLNLGFTDRPFSDIEEKYGRYGLEYLSFIYHPVFDRVGELKIYASEKEYIYEVVPGGLKKLETTYDSEEGVHIIKTRRLGDYVVSSKLLSQKNKKLRTYNPPTGIN